MIEKDKTLWFLERIAQTWITNAIASLETNTYLTIGPKGPEFEVLSNYELNLKGTGASSCGFDHNDGSEDKGANLVQPKDCNSGGTNQKPRCVVTGKLEKVHPYSDKCPKCNRDYFLIHNDSRWGIDTNSHFKYDIKKYNCWVFYPEGHNPMSKTYYLELYRVDSSNPNFQKILEIQYKYGSKKNKNFLPFSSDFYASGPTMLSKFKIDYQNDYFECQRLQTEEIVYDNKILNILDPYLVNSFVQVKNSYTYNEIKEFIDIEKKVTKHGKERGEISRRI
jgi:hypothetical protein